jgi:hypothetical protein
MKVLTLLRSLSVTGCVVPWGGCILPPATSAHRNVAQALHESADAAVFVGSVGQRPDLSYARCPRSDMRIVIFHTMKKAEDASFP